MFLGNQLVGGDFYCFLCRIGLFASQCCVHSVFSVVFFPTRIIPGVFGIVTSWCVRGAKDICVGAVGVDDVWVVCFCVDGTWSTVSPNIFANFCNASPWRPWNV